MVGEGLDEVVGEEKTKEDEKGEEEEEEEEEEAGMLGMVTEWRVMWGGWAGTIS